VLRGFSELPFLSVIDVRSLALGEPEHEECSGPSPKKDDGPITFRSSLPWSGDPLFDDPTTKVGIDLAFLGPSNSIAQDRIRNSFFSGKALKPSGFEDSHACA
jgi:hypothetical protein